MSKDARCESCPARFGGADPDAQLAAHVAGFHPAGAPVERVITSQADARAVGKDYGPAVQGIAGEVGDLKLVVDDIVERVKALEEHRRSETDLDVLAEQVAPRLGQLAPPASEPVATTSEPEGPTYADLQARAKELGIPAVGKREELQVAIADEEGRLAADALAARTADQGGESSPASDPDAQASGEAGTPPGA